MSQLPTIKNRKEYAPLPVEKPEAKAIVVRKEIEVRRITLTIPALVGLANRTPVQNVNLRLLSREAKALSILVDGFDHEIFESPGSRSAGPQDFLRHILSDAADQLGL